MFVLSHVGKQTTLLYIYEPWTQWHPSQLHPLLPTSSIQYLNVSMPYTALQTLGYLASCSNWERIYNINRPRSTKRTRCRLVAYSTKYLKSGRKVVVFKRTAAGSKWAPACGYVDCGVCGRFVGKWIVYMLDVGSGRKGWDS